MDTKTRIRILLARHPLEGHTRGYNIVAMGLRDAGFEVVLGGAMMPKEMVKTALEEDADFIGYRITSASPTVLTGMLFEEMKKNGVNIPVIVGGCIHEKTAKLLKNAGVAEVFRPGTPFSTIAESIRNVAKKEPRKATSDV